MSDWLIAYHENAQEAARRRDADQKTGKRG
jgi:hypothetical protein